MMDKTYKGNVDSLPGIPCKNCDEKDRQIADLTIKLDGQYEINGYLAQESVDREKKIEEIKTQLECNALLLIEINRQADGEIADLKAKLVAETKRADELREKINKMLKHFPDTVSGIINAMEANDGK